MSIYIVTLLSIYNLSIFINQRSAADRRPGLHSSYQVRVQCNSLKFALMPFFFAFQFLGGGPGPLGPPGHAPGYARKTLLKYR